MALPRSAWKPGQSGNPNGRPKGSGLNLTRLLKDKLEEVPEGKKEPYKELFIKTLLHKALIDKDMHSMRLVMNYVDGLPTQRIESEVTVKEYKWADYEDDNISTEEVDQTVS